MPGTECIGSFELLLFDFTMTFFIFHSFVISLKIMFKKTYLEWLVGPVLTLPGPMKATLK